MTHAPETVELVARLLAPQAWSVSAQEHIDCCAGYGFTSAEFFGEQFRVMRAEASAKAVGVLDALAKAGLLTGRDVRNAALQEAADRCDEERMGHARDVILDMIGEPAAPILAVPDGWQLVPKVATEAMMVAGVIGCDIADSMPTDDCAACYAAMIAAAPAAPERTP